MRKGNGVDTFLCLRILPVWANYTSSWSKSLAIDKIDSHTVVSLTILGRTDGGSERASERVRVCVREREREREPGGKKGEGKRKKNGGETGRGGEGALYFESNVCMHICIRIQAERSMYN